jgi:hypothetical protein
MPSHEKLPSRMTAGGEYTYRRKLSLRELLPAIAVGVGAGLFAFYVTRLLTQRTPLRVERETRSPRLPRSERTPKA